jgi:CRISPR/Cas system CSM-associated protein Csm2 small subunit
MKASEGGLFVTKYFNIIIMTIHRTDSHSSDFKNLVKSLDATLAHHNGDNDDFFAQFNKIDTIKNCIVAYIDEVPAACGAFKTI